MRNMNFIKKLAVLGLIGTMAVGQCVSALAATGYSLSAPSVTKLELVSGLTYNIQVKAQITSDYSKQYLGLEETLRYKNAAGVDVYTATKDSMSNSVSSSYIYNPIFSGRGISQSQFNLALAQGYYRTTANPDLDGYEKIHIGQKTTTIY